MFKLTKHAVDDNARVRAGQNAIADARTRVQTAVAARGESPMGQLELNLNAVAEARRGPRNARELPPRLDNQAAGQAAGLDGIARGIVADERAAAEGQRAAGHRPDEVAFQCTFTGTIVFNRTQLFAAMGLPGGPGVIFRAPPFMNAMHDAAMGLNVHGMAGNVRVDGDGVEKAEMDRIDLMQQQARAGNYVGNADAGRAEEKAQAKHQIADMRDINHAQQLDNS